MPAVDVELRLETTPNARCRGGTTTHVSVDGRSAPGATGMQEEGRRDSQRIGQDPDVFGSGWRKSFSYRDSAAWVTPA